MRDIQTGKEVRELLSEGLEKLASVVSVTLGPRGSNVVIDRKYRTPIVTKDGFEAAKEIFLHDPYESMGCEIAKEAANKLANSSGDGTTTTIMLASFIVKNSLKLFHEGNPIKIIGDMKDEVDRYCDFAQKMSHSPVTASDVGRVATISANNDEKIGELLAEVYRETRHTRVAITKYGGIEDKLLINKGLEINRGWLLPHFANNPKSNAWEAENVRILICHEDIDDITKIIPVMEYANKTGTPLLIIIDNMSGQALSTIVINAVKGLMNVCVVRSPASDEKRDALLEDIAIVTGGQVICEQTGTSLLDLAHDGKRENFLGTAANVRVTRDTCLISGGKGDPEIIKSRIEQVSEMSFTALPAIKNFYQERVARLEGGTAEIKVGGDTEVEMEQRRWRIEDAVCACRSAVDGGIVPGGGTMYHHYAHQRLAEGYLSEASKNFLLAMREPMYSIIMSCGYNHGEAMSIASDCADQSKMTERETIGFNALVGERAKMEAVGIVEPTMVSTEVLRAAFSVAQLILNSEAIVVPSTGQADPLEQIRHNARK